MFNLFSKLLFVQNNVSELFQNEVALKAIVTSFFFQGAFLIMSVYMFLLYIQTRKKDYLFYGTYLIIFACYLFIRIELTTQTSLLTSNRQFYYHLITPLNFLIASFYVKFISTFGELKKYNKSFAIRLDIFYYLFILLSILVLVYTIVTKDFNSIEKYQHYIVLPMHLYTLAALVRAFIVIKSNLRYYILFGNIFLLVFSAVGYYNTTGSFFSENIDSNFFYGFYSFNVTQLGAFLEVICFSLGLGYKFRLIEKEKNEVKQKYIEQLKENEIVTKQLNEELTHLVAERTKEIQIKNKLLREEQQEKLKSEFNQKLIKSELTSLRARINPHFIFNSLNSIKSFIISNDVKKSVSYFSKFAKLLRYSINNSSTEFVNLNDEIEFLKDYVALESLRLSHVFKFIIEVPDHLDIKPIQVPPLIIQPFIENAIRHGLALKKSKGLLKLSIKTTGKNLEIYVEDNGVGRAASSIISKSKTHISKGISITTERLEIFSKVYNLKKSFEIIDLVDEANKPLGTKVIIKLPLLNNEEILKSTN